MFCPTCNTQNLATSVRCENCRSTLIFEAEGHSEKYYEGAQILDEKMYSGIGYAAGLFLAVFILKVILADMDLGRGVFSLSAIGAAFLGSFIGRQIARWKSRWR